MSPVTLLIGKNSVTVIRCRHLTSQTLSSSSGIRVGQSQSNRDVFTFYPSTFLPFYLSIFFGLFWPCGKAEKAFAILLMRPMIIITKMFLTLILIEGYVVTQTSNLMHTMV